jgi:hypothetical protein
MKIGKQDGGGLMTSSVIGSEHSFDSIVSSTFMPRSVPWPCSSHGIVLPIVQLGGMGALLEEGNASGQEVRQHHQ